MNDIQGSAGHATTSGKATPPAGAAEHDAVVSRWVARHGKRPILLFVINDIPFFLSHRLPIARAAVAHGFDVHIAGQGAEDSADLKALGFTGHDVALGRGMVGGVGQSLTALRQFYRLFRSLRPAVIHAVTVKPVLIAGIAARLAGTAGVVHALTGLGFIFASSTVKGRLLKQAVAWPLGYALNYGRARTIVQNPDDREALIRVTGVRADRISLIKGSGVDCARFSPQPEAAGSPIVVLGSRMLWDKGIAQFVEAAKMLRQSGIDARFVLAGKSDSFNPASVPEEQLKAWDAAGDVEYWGQRSDMDRVFAEAHIVCLPSYYGEGVPKVLIEAAAAGRPIVTTDSPGCREIGRDGDNAILVPVRDAASLAAALRRLIEDPALRARMGARGREIVLAEFSEEHVVTQTVELYEALLAERG